MVFTFFHTAYETPSGPGADEGEDLARALAISSLVSGTAEGLRWRRPLGGSSTPRRFFFFFFFSFFYIMYSLLRYKNSHAALAMA